MSFKIVVDSCCDLTPAMLKDPVFVRFENRIFPRRTARADCADYIISLGNMRHAK